MSSCLSLRWLFLLCMVITGCRQQATEERVFTKISPEQSGIHFNNQIAAFENDTLNIQTYDPMYNGAGVGVGDFNRDGRMDLFFAGNKVSSRLYLNQGNLVFADVTEKAKVSTQRWCTGVSIADVNQDGWPDIYVCVAGPDTSHRQNLLFINQHCQPGQTPVFTEMAAVYGLNDNGMSTQAAFFDYDRDGDLDCYVLTNAVEATGRNTMRPKRTNGEGPSTDRLYRNEGIQQGHPVFHNVSRQAGILKEGYGLGLAICDLNRDGWLDIYCANDFISNDLAWINNHDGTFTDQAAAYFKHTTYNSMGVDVQDMNNDALPDVMVVDMLPEPNSRQKMMVVKTNWEFLQLARSRGYQDEYVRNTLQLHQGFGTDEQPVFSEIGYMSGIYATDWSWAALLEDLDNDGWKDLLVSNGYRRDITNLDYVAYLNDQYMLYGNQHSVADKREKLKRLYQLPDVKIHNYLYHNKGDLTFEDRSQTWGLGDPTYSNGAATVDLDNDGDLDLVFNNIDDPAGIYRNNTAQNTISEKAKTSHIQFNLPLDAKGLGAEVFVYPSDSSSLMKIAHPVRGYASSVDPTVHFGVGSQTQAQAEIHWADGSWQHLGLLATDSVYTITYKPNAVVSFRTNKSSPLFQTANAASTGLTYVHEELPINDFQQNPLLRQMYSRNSPGMAVADADGNGLDDVFVGADPQHIRSLFLQTSPGKFKELRQGSNELEDMGALFFDADTDGDPDLYVVSGGSLYRDSTLGYEDRLYLNDGKGKLTRSKELIPQTLSSGSCVVAADFDRDGDLDLFRGGRVQVTGYPHAPRSYVLRNDGGRFTDVTEIVSPELAKPGMVTSALWSDYNNDGWTDLVVTGEFMPVLFFKNENGKTFRKSASKIQNQVGWFNSLAAADFDHDGDTDYIAGNTGLNTRYKATIEKPIRLYAKDFDQNGRIDPILTEIKDGKEHIVPMRDLVNEQLPIMKKKFPSYQAFANATFANVFSSNELRDVFTLEATELRSLYIENRGNEFVSSPLPMPAQCFPIFGIQTDDFNGDGRTDVLLVGNSFSQETYGGWYDAGRGCLLLGDGVGSFRAVSSSQAGLHVSDDAKALVRLAMGSRTAYVVSNNNQALQLLLPIQTQKEIIKLNYDDAYGHITTTGGQRIKTEFYHGSGYLSQSSRMWTLPANAQKIEIVTYQGVKRTIAKSVTLISGNVKASLAQSDKTTR